MNNQQVAPWSRLSLDYHNLAILNSLPIGVVIYAIDGTTIYVNNNFLSILGLEISEVIDKNIFEDPTVPDEVKRVVHSGDPLHICLPFFFSKNADKPEQHYVECKGQSVCDNGEFKSYVITIEDVSEKVRKDEELKYNRRKSEVAMNDADIVLWEFNVGSLVFYSDNEPLNQYHSSQPIAIKEYADIVHEDDLDHVNELFRRMSLAEDFSFSIECRMLLPTTPEWQYYSINGSPYEYDDNGNVVKYIGTRKNISAIYRKRKLQETILNSIPLSIHIKDMENAFKYIFCNEESVKMFGSCYHKTTSDIVEKSDAESIQKIDEEVFSTGVPYFGHEHIILNDGRAIDTIVRKSIIEDEGKRLLLNIHWDQTLQKDLQRRAKLLALTMETMNAFTWFYEPDKRKVMFGDGFDKVGDPAVINTLESYLTYVHPDDRELFANTLCSTVDRTSEIWKVEYRMDMQNSGVYQWWETRGKFEAVTINGTIHKYMFGMTICIDEHKKTEITLLENKEKLDLLVCQNELVLNNSSSGLAYITRDYIVQWENLSTCSKSLTNNAYKKGEICYKSTHNRTSPCEDCVLQRAIESRQTEQIKFNLDGSHIVEIFATPVFLEDGYVDGIVIRVDDVTERERMINELQEAKLLAEESDRLKSAFLANMSHEIRTPLNAIVGFSEVLMSCATEERDEYMQIIKTNNELLLKLIGDILDLSKIEAGSVELVYEEFDLAEYFNSMALSMKRRVKSPNVQFVSINPFLHCRVNLDRNRVVQIVTNYVTNAIKYTSKGCIEMGYEQCKGGIYIYVKDTGIGIVEDKKEKVFYRFEKLDEFAQGTGLGLSICKAIAESMGGKVGFESTSGTGSNFWVFFPCEVNAEYDPLYLQK